MSFSVILSTLSFPIETACIVCRSRVYLMDRRPSIFRLDWHQQCFSALTLLVGLQEGHPACKKFEWWGAVMVICLERGADLHMAQLMPLPLTASCFSKIQIGFTFLVPVHLGSPGKEPLNGCVIWVWLQQWAAAGLLLTSYWLMSADWEGVANRYRLIAAGARARAAVSVSAVIQGGWMQTCCTGTFIPSVMLQFLAIT